MRSPALHAAELQCPLKLFYGEAEKPFIAQAQPLLQRARKAKKSAQMEVIPNTNHFTALKPAIERMIKYFDQ